MFGSVGNVGNQRTFRVQAMAGFRATGCFGKPIGNVLCTYEKIESGILGLNGRWISVRETAEIYLEFFAKVSRRPEGKETIQL
jgi:hypothetical protein